MRAIDGDALKERYESHRNLYCKNRIEFKLLSEKDKARVDELDNCIADILNAPTIEPEQRWIPSGEKPPEKGSYLVWMPFAPSKHRMTVAEYCGGYWNIKTPISAWMPLPEPYKEERREE